jgi:hypothetical protein
VEKNYRGKERLLSSNRKDSLSSEEVVTKKEAHPRFQHNVLIPKITTKFYGLLDRKNQLFSQKKNQAGFRLLSAVLKSENSRIIATDNCQCGLKIKTQTHYLRNPL